MSGILISCLSDAVRLRPFVFDHRKWKDQARKDINLGTHKNDTNYFVFSPIIYWLNRTEDKSKNKK